MKAVGDDVGRFLEVKRLSIGAGDTESRAQEEFKDSGPGWQRA